MSRASAIRLVWLCSFIIFCWGIVYIFLSGSVALRYSSPDSGLFDLEWISKGILFMFTGMVLFHLPSLLRRGEYQALRILNFTFFFLLALTIWHALKSPPEEISLKVTTLVLGVCSLLLLVALVQLRRGRHLPRF
jgi:peptidoglycan/LPS O-acetylase OafA/YrhL